MVQTTLLATVTIMQEKYAPEKIILIEHTYTQNIFYTLNEADDHDNWL